MPPASARSLFAVSTLILAGVAVPTPALASGAGNVRELISVLALATILFGGALLIGRGLLYLGFRLEAWGYRLLAPLVIASSCLPLYLVVLLAVAAS